MSAPPEINRAAGTRQARPADPRVRFTGMEHPFPAVPRPPGRMMPAYRLETAAGSPAPIPLAPVLRRQIGCWLVEFDGVTARADDLPGMHHLAVLLARPRERIPALVLEQSGPRLERRGSDARRELHDARERAREGVATALTAAIEALAGCHPALGEHLRDSVVTGMLCSYDPPDRWR